MTFQLPATYYDPPEHEETCPFADHSSCSEWECEHAAEIAAEDDALARAEYERDDHYDRH